MSKITEILNKSGVEDLSEISMLENFFEDYEIKSELEIIEKNRKKRQLILIIIIPTIIFGLMYLFSAGIVNIGNGNNGFDGIWIYVMLIILIFSGVVKFFHNKIEGAIKQKILSKLSKKVYENLEYDEGKKYAFNDILKLVNEDFLNGYQRIDKVEDSIAFALNKDGRRAIIQGYELQTSEMRGSGKNRRRVITNHCYLLKTTIPNARIKLEKNLLIKTDEADSYSGSLSFALIGVILGLFLVGFLINIVDSKEFLLIIPILFGSIAYFGRRKYINSKRVKLENMEFEKMFDVHCEDQIGSRMIITPAFMDRLVTFARKSKYRYEFLFNSDCFYIKWKINGRYLEINTWQNITKNINSFILWYIEMKNIISLIKDMQILYLSKTTDNLSNDFKVEYETFGELPNNSINLFGNNGIFSKVFKKNI